MAINSKDKDKVININMGLSLEKLFAGGWKFTTTDEYLDQLKEKEKPKLKLVKE